MRDLLDHADLSRYAGQFVWLELNYDAPENRAFLTKFGAEATPLFFVIDPRNEHVTATQPGAMSLQEIKEFLDRGASGVFAKGHTPADAALARGDTLRALQPEDAAGAYKEALRLAPRVWPQSELAKASLVGALQDAGQWEECAETAAREAARMKRNVMFGRTVMTGMWCVVSAEPAPWWEAAARSLESLSKEALSLSITVRDHRDELYRTLMRLSLARNDNASAAKWGDAWLAELDAIKPASDDERSALDIARVENIEVYGDPARVLPALIESERAMPNNYIASLRLAEMQLAANHDEEAIAACDRALSRGAGASGRVWLLQMKAKALNHQGRAAEARLALEEALKTAEDIPDKMMREMKVGMLSKSLSATEKPAN